MDLWKKTLRGLQSRVEPWDYKHWILPVQCDATDEVAREIVLAVPDESHGRWLEDHFSGFFHEEFEKLGKGDYRIRYTTYDVAGSAKRVPSKRGASTAPAAVSMMERAQPTLPLEAAARAPTPFEVGPADVPSSGLFPAHVASDGALEGSLPVARPAMAIDAVRAEPPRGVPELHEPIEPPALNARYRFDSFVDGPTNQFAMSAAHAVADHPGTRYNPLFIFGGVGLGKTHLLHAVGHAVREKNPHARVRYVTSEQFVNDLIHAIRTDKMPHFRARYRDRCDVLLIDDIQFIAGKDRTQEEFFHLFNALHSSHKQIVLTCDQLPQTIPDLEDRLRSRLTWGLTADIKPPGFETRVAILKAKAEVDGIELSDEVAMLVARHVTKNVRELEGALVKLSATTKLLGRPIDLDLAHQALGSLIGQGLQRIAPDAILKAVAAEYKVTLAELKGPRRHRNITVPRQIAMYLLRELTDESLPQIGHLFGGRDHSTVINSLKRVEALRAANPEVRAQLDRLRRVVRD